MKSSVEFCFLACSTTRVQKSRLFKLVFKSALFALGGVCPGESCSCADAGFGCCVQSPPMGGGEEPNQTEFKHLRTMGSRRNGGNLEPIQSHSALADVGPKGVFLVTKSCC